MRVRASCGQARPIVWVLAEYYLPAYKAGGPIRSLENLISTFGDEYDFRVITRSHDLGTADLLPGIRCGQWVPVGKAVVFYLRRGWRGLPAFLRILLGIRQQPGAIYLNTFCSRKFSILPMFLASLGILPRRSIALAPRGELSASALRLRRRRKRAYLFLAKRSGLYNNILWHASSHYEADDIRRKFPEVRLVFEAALLAGFHVHQRSRSDAGQILTASDLIAPRQVEAAEQGGRTKRGGEALIAFVGRIVPIKNLAYALTVLYQVPGDITFDIYGPAENADYWRQCQKMIANAPRHVKVTYKGVIPADRVPNVLSEYHLLLLPTFSENFGHVIAESLLCGVPVLISDGTPWRGLEPKRVGWDLPINDPGRFVGCIASLVNMEDKDWQAMSKRARQFAEARCFDNKLIEANAQLLALAVSRSTTDQRVYLEAQQVS